MPREGSGRYFDDNSATPTTGGAGASAGRRPELFAMEGVLGTTARARPGSRATSLISVVEIVTRGDVANGRGAGAGGEGPRPSALGNGTARAPSSHWKLRYVL